MFEFILCTIVVGLLMTWLALTLKDIRNEQLLFAEDIKTIDEGVSNLYDVLFGEDEEDNIQGYQ